MKRCFLCLGSIRGDPDGMVVCRCGRAYHAACAERVGKCPVCGDTISGEDPNAPLKRYLDIQHEMRRKREEGMTGEDPEMCRLREALEEASKACRKHGIIGIIKMAEER